MTFHGAFDATHPRRDEAAVLELHPNLLGQHRVRARAVARKLLRRVVRAEFAVERA